MIYANKGMIGCAGFIAKRKGRMGMSDDQKIGGPLPVSESCYDWLFTE
jgi:hypothetical protein